MIKWLEKKCYPDHPKVGTAEELCEWEKVERSKPICDFIVNKIPMWYSTRIAMPLQDLKWWFKYRVFTKHKYQLIDTGLEPNYYEIETRMLHGMFNMLKEFVEEESSWNTWVWKDDAKPKFKPGRESGLESLAWQKELVFIEEEIWKDEDKHLIGKPTPQAETATEIEALYLWWVDTRPARVDPMEAFPDPYFDKLIEEGGCSMRILCKRPPEEEEKRRERYKKTDALRKQYDDEDDEMFHRLIKIRRSMWT